MSDFTEQFRVQRKDVTGNTVVWRDLADTYTNQVNAVDAARLARNTLPDQTYRVVRRVVITSDWVDLFESSRFTPALTAIIDALDEIASDAEDCGELAITHKIEEGIGRIHNARNASEQYFDGTLEPR